MLCCQNSMKPVECVHQPMAKRKPKTHRLRSRLQGLEDQFKEEESQPSKLDEPLPDTPSVTQARLGIISEESGANSVKSSRLLTSFDRGSPLKARDFTPCPMFPTC